MDLGRLSVESLLEADFHVVAQVGAALAAAGGPPLATHHVAENVLEDIREATGPEPLCPAHAAVFEGCVAETVIGGPLLRVLERFVGLVDFLELVLAGGVTGIAIGMELHGELAERALELLVVRPLLHPERFVEISLHRLSWAVGRLGSSVGAGSTSAPLRGWTSI